MNYGTNWSTYDLFEEESSHKFSDSINAIKPRTLLKGYFLNYRYFQHIDKSETISIFQLKEPKPTFVEYSKQINNRKILGIHVRCYEYGHREFHGILPPEYFRESVLLAKKLNDIDDIVVFTDNKFEASKILSDAWINPSEIIDSSKAISASETILLMSKVKSFIGSNSSFSWWSAYLCQDVDRVSIFPRPWYKNHETIIGSQYLPKWITIGFNKWL
jgi:hypothetical protein